MIIILFSAEEAEKAHIQWMKHKEAEEKKKKSLRKKQEAKKTKKEEEKENEEKIKRQKAKEKYAEWLEGIVYHYLYYDHII